MHVIDKEGYRANIGIIVSNDAGQVLLAKRIGQDAWQFPQGGMQPNETPEQALYRELHEELGLEAKDVIILGCTKNWLRYRLPHHFRRHQFKPVCIGQKQKWFLLKLMSDPSLIRFDHTEKPEFDGWRWESYWQPIQEVIHFKRKVYNRALRELAGFLPETIRPHTPEFKKRRPRIRGKYGRGRRH